jgi:hypothetical protein
LEIKEYVDITWMLYLTRLDTLPRLQYSCATPTEITSESIETKLKANMNVKSVFVENVRGNLKK